MTQTAVQSYQTQQIMTASPAKLVALLYDKAVASLNEAAGAIARGDIEARHNANRKAIDIVAHLWGTLDLERGGEIAANLDALYSFMMRRLGEVDSKNDAQAAEDVIRLIEPLRKSWHALAAGAAGAAGTGETNGTATAQAETPAEAPATSLTLSA